MRTEPPLALVEIAEAFEVMSRPLPVPAAGAYPLFSGAAGRLPKVALARPGARVISIGQACRDAKSFRSISIQPASTGAIVAQSIDDTLGLRLIATRGTWKTLEFGRIDDCCISLPFFRNERRPR